MQAVHAVAAVNMRHQKCEGLPPTRAMLASFDFGGVIERAPADVQTESVSRNLTPSYRISVDYCDS